METKEKRGFFGSDLKIITDDVKKSLQKREYTWKWL